MSSEGESDLVTSDDIEVPGPRGTSVPDFVDNQLARKCVRNFPLGKPINDETGLELDTVVSVEIQNDQRVVTLSGGENLIEPKRTHTENTGQAEVDVLYNAMLENDNLKTPFTVTNTIHETAHKQPIYAAAFNHYQRGNRAQLATAARDMISVYDCPLETNDLTLVRCFVDDNCDESYFTITWCYDIVAHRCVLVAAGNSAFIKVIDPANGELLQEMWGHGDVVNELRTDPSNSMLFASVSKDTTIRIWNIRTSLCLVVFGGIEGHLDQVLSCDWSPDSKFLVSCGMDHSVRMWHINPEARKLIDYSMTPHGEAELLEFTPGTGENLPTKHIHYPNAWTTDLHCDYVDCVRFVGWHLVSKGSERAANLYRFGHFDEPFDQVFRIKADSACTRIAQLNLPECDVWFLKFDVDPVGRWVVFGSKSGELYFFNMRDRDFPEGDPDFSIKVSSAPIRQVCFGANGRLLVAVTDDYSVIKLERNFRAEQRSKRLKLQQNRDRDA